MWIDLAEISCTLKDYSGVASLVEEYRAWDPASPRLYVADEILGRSLKNQARFPQAREAFERVIRHPQGKRTETAAKSQFLVAETYLLEKNFQQAQKEYLKVEVLYKFPQWQAPALFQSAVCLETLQKWKAAAADYDQLIKRYPESEYTAKARARMPEVLKRAQG